MVKIAVAGFGEVSREIIKAVLVEGHHDITVLSRKDAPLDLPPGLSWAKIDYQDKRQLVDTLKGVHTVLSFIVVQQDPGSVSQINLIDACVAAGVTRYFVNNFPMYEGKLQVLEYCLFVPGVFMNYLAPLKKIGADIAFVQLFVDFENCRAVVPEDPEGHDSTVSFTTIQGVARVVTKALDYEGEWPVRGGISASKTSISDLLQLGEMIRGKPFSIERIKKADLQANNFTMSWAPTTNHPAVPVEQRELAAKDFMRIILMGLADGVLDMSNEWNQRLPDLELTTLGSFLRDAWGTAE
ncbi:hypothetical protein NM208_g5288 [Fusarium decemcellulare]|uniref:Uncharacterized protein n=1 Tax=Fusarium decemcellulare TaxID=57161 RepID=A0ACC1SHH7_9HYPO|nr:hypothetical protein NM208_g5288 [Fusarium decemcellulare]